MADYIVLVLECLECNHKDIYVNGRSDGKRCINCGSGLYFPIDGGKKSEMMVRHNLTEDKRKIRYPPAEINRVLIRRGLTRLGLLQKIFF